MTRIALSLMMLLLVPARLRAADARELFQSGSKALQAGKADEALKDFDAAYAAQPSPSLLFYLGEAHRALGHRAQAEDYYRKYIAEFPIGPKVAEARQRFAELRAQAADEESKAPEVKTAPGKTKKKRGKKKESAKLALEEVDLRPAAPASPPLALTPLVAPKPAAPAPAPAAPAPAPAAPATAPAAPVAAKAAPAPAAPAPAAPPLVVAAASPPAPTPAPAPPALAAKAVPAVDQAPAASPAPAAVPASTPRVAERSQLGTARTPMLATTGPDKLHFVTYTGRLLVMKGTAMKSYASYLFGKSSALYTHGIAFGMQSETFKNAVYVGFGTEWGGGNETLQRYEFSWQFAWAPLGTQSLFNPHLGFRLGAMGVTSDRLTQGGLEPGIVVAPQVGIDLQAGRHVVVTAGMSYDANIGPGLTPTSSISGYSYDLGGSIRF